MFKDPGIGKGELRVMSLGRWSDVNENLFVYETEKDILVFDCGLGFPDDPDSEIDVLVPDVNYLERKKEKIRGIVISHGHLDHYGALPFVLPKLGNPPVYATRLVKGFIESELADFNMSAASLKLIDIKKKSFSVGSFELFPFRVNHSVPDSLGFCLKTPAGLIFHVSDFKFDLTPVDGKVFQINRAANLAQSKVLAMFSDCLGSVHPGFTSSEKEIEKIFDQILSEAKQQVFITTLSSNISRFQQAINSSLRHKRKVVLLGRSVEEKTKIAQRLSYLNFPKGTFIRPRKAMKMPPEKVTYLISGSYGQSNSALGRVAVDDYRNAKILPGAVFVFSADPAPPGTRENVDALVDRLIIKGAKVYYYEIQENLHVSGHGSANDIRLLMSIVRPEFYIPIGGNPRHVRAYSFLAEEMGAQKEKVLELFDGEVLQFSSGQVRVVGEIDAKPKAYKKK